MNKIRNDFKKIFGIFISSEKSEFIQWKTFSKLISYFLIFHAIRKVGKPKFWTVKRRFSFLLSKIVFSYGLKIFTVHCSIPLPIGVLRKITTHYDRRQWSTKNWRFEELFAFEWCISFEKIFKFTARKK